MIESIRFPSYTGQRYYHSHFRFFLRFAHAAGLHADLYESDRQARGFEIMLDGARAIVDFGDHLAVPNDIGDFDLAFKYHYSEARHKEYSNLYPLTPISFYDWAKYFQMRNRIIYKAHGEMILNNQKPGAAAIQRRKRVQWLLSDRFGGKVDTTITKQERFWKKAGSCLVSVCVPGARNDILDRGQFQFWAFGACTISPQLDITLPFWRKAEPGVHYIECREDYSNLVEIVEWCQEHREECRKIGSQAKALFHETSVPNKVWDWINRCVEEVT